jgi:hypothetical protein
LDWKRNGFSGVISGLDGPVAGILQRGDALFG